MCFNVFYSYKVVFFYTYSIFPLNVWRFFNLSVKFKYITRLCLRIYHLSVSSLFSMNLIYVWFYHSTNFTLKLTTNPCLFSDFIRNHIRCVGFVFVVGCCQVLFSLTAFLCLSLSCLEEFLACSVLSDSILFNANSWFQVMSP